MAKGRRKTKATSASKKKAAAEQIPQAEPEQVTEAEPEQVTEAEPEQMIEADPEPVTQAKPEPVTQAEPEPVTQAESELVTQAEPEPVTQAEPEPVTQAEPEPVTQAEPEPVTQEPEPVTHEEPEGEEAENDQASSGGKKKKKKKKRRKHPNFGNDSGSTTQLYSSRSQTNSTGDVEIEYVPEPIDVRPGDPLYRQFYKIFEAFKIAEEVKEEEKKETKPTPLLNPPAVARGALDGAEEEEDEDEKKEEDDKPKMSKKQMKREMRMSIAELKKHVSRPDVVEMHDVTSKEPKLLVHLKGYRNTVPVPRHWCFKRKYLQGKRGVEKPPFDLPDFIKKTGIMEMRAALQEKEDQKTLKAKTRQKVRPKLGKIDIDYQKLHDAFFRWQTKPRLTLHGDIYYEGKEFETKLKDLKPGDLSDDLRTALGMPIGLGKQMVPPPWLIAMQRYGPPPSYPNLRVPGLNAPIPENCSFGYHAGGWGKPPVDENGKPLYGDVFGTDGVNITSLGEDEAVDTGLWGELESESEDESDSEDESSDEDDDEEKADDTGLVTPLEGLITPSGLTSIPAGLETPELIELRKQTAEEAVEGGGDTPAVFQVIPEKRATVGGALMGSQHVYDLSALSGAPKKAPAPDGIEIALDPSELEMDQEDMARRYEEIQRQQEQQIEKEDFSDMVAEHAAKQKNKRKKQADQTKGAKKYKEFKF